MAEQTVHEVKVGIGGPMGPPAKMLSARPAAAEKTGYSSMWWGDHYMGWLPRTIWTPDISPVAQPGTNPDVLFDSVAAMAVAGAATSTLTLGITTESIRRHPVALAQQFLTLQHITGNRTILGIGGGEGENLIPYGFSFEKPVGRMEEGMRIIRKLWENDGPIDFDGEHYQLKDAVLGLSAPEGRPLDMWVMGWGPRMCRIAGELGDGWLPTMMAPAEYGERIERIRTARERAGRQEDPFTVGLFALAVIAESVEAAEPILEHPFVKGMCLPVPASNYERFGATHPLGEKAISEYIPGRVGRDKALELIAGVPEEVVRGNVLHGSPDDVREQLRPFAELGMEHVVLLNISPLANPAGARESFALMDELATGLRYERTPLAREA